jgi:membrane protein YqaA with SNARE-associated domain
MAAYLGLFTAALVAATILPAQSEALLAYLIASGNYPVAVLVAVASLGNVLGSAINWALGRGIAGFHGRRWFPVSDTQLERARNWYHRYGRWSLLASWVPIMGDPITVVAGVLKEPLATFLLLVTIAKTGRYLALAWMVMEWA